MMYRLTALVSPEMLGELITAATPLVSGALQIEVAETPTQLPQKTRHRRQYAGRGDYTRVGHTGPQGGITPAEKTRTGRIVLTALSTGPCSADQLKLALGEHGFAPTGESPIVSKLKAAEMVRVDEVGTRWITDVGQEYFLAHISGRAGQ